MNEGAAKAYRRDVRARGESTLNVPGKAVKALWGSLSHRERGQWRRKLEPSRASLRSSCTTERRTRLPRTVFGGAR